MGKKGMAWITLSLAAGVIASEWVSFTSCVFAACCLFLIAFPLLRGHARITATIIISVFVLGAGRYTVSREIAPADISRFIGRTTAVEGYIISDPEAVADRVRLQLNVARVKTDSSWRHASGNLMLTVYPNGKNNLQLDYGDHIRVAASPYTPFDPTNPGQFSWKQYLARQHIYVCATVRSSSRVRRLSGEHASLLMRAALAAKRHITKSIQHVFPKDEASLVVGMVLGTYAYLPHDTLEDFARTGTLHLLAASGYNCFIVLFLAAPILRWMRIFPRFGNLVMLCLLVMYLAMVGMKPSLIRATIMAGLLLVGWMMKRVPNIKNLFFVAGFIMLMIEPSYIFDVGFQLSYLGVWAVITVIPLLEASMASVQHPVNDPKSSIRPFIALQKRVGGEIGGAALATIAVTLVTTPLVAYYFNYFSLVSVPANIVMALGVPIVFAAGVLAAVFAPIQALAHLVGWAGGFVTRVMLDALSYFGGMKYSAVYMASPNLLAMIGYYVILQGLLGYVRERYAKK